MNSTISKTFYTCSKKSLFLKYKKVSKEAVKLGSFLHFSVHISDMIAASEKLI